MFIRKLDSESWFDKRFFLPVDMYHDGLEILVWGAVDYSGALYLIWVNPRGETVDSEKYQ
jgi:hypothetical protein